jgi:hypothetical protein
MKIMKLWSNDGQDYTWPVIIPEGMDDQQAWLAAKNAINRAQEEHPEDWSQDDITPLLEAVGFKVVPYMQGPLWD